MNIKIKNENLFNIKRDIGVYLLKCIPENRIYIGSTNQSFRARFSNHYKFLKNGNLGNKKLQEDYNKYGESNFEFEIIGVYPENLTVNYEKQFIDSLNPYYNVNKACNNSKTNKNKKFSESHKEKIREKAKLFKHKNIEDIIKQNKTGANKFKIIEITTNDEFFINSKLELISFLELSCPERFYNKQYKNYYIEVLKTQRKKIQLLVNNDWIEFSSYEKCDKFLNKWRGYTSTQMLKNKEEIDNFKVKII